MPDTATAGGSTQDPLFHDLANIYPLMQGEEFDGLVQSIKETGQLVPIVMHERKVLDGRNRWRACEKLGIEPKTVEFPGGDLLTFVLEVNAHRRNLTASQRAMIAARQMNAPAHRVKKSAKLQTSMTCEIAAARFNVSPRLVMSAAYVAKNGNEKYIALVVDGDRSVGEVEKWIKDEEKHERREAARAKERQAEADRVAALNASNATKKAKKEPLPAAPAPAVAASPVGSAGTSMTEPPEAALAATEDAVEGTTAEPIGEPPEAAVEDPAPDPDPPPSPYPDATPVPRPKRETVKLELDADVMAAARSEGHGWKERINDILRAALLGGRS